MKGPFVAEYTLPELPYDYAALEPHISAKIMELHHSKHHATYVAGANTALEKLAEARDNGTMAALARMRPRDRGTIVQVGSALAFRGIPLQSAYCGAKHAVRVLPAHIAPLAAHMIEKIPPDLSKFLICPMPGLLVSLHVKEGDTVQPGQPLATVEAMKMENILRAEKAGTVARVNAEQGASLAVDEIILELA